MMMTSMARKVGSGDFPKVRVPSLGWLQGMYRDTLGVIQGYIGFWDFQKSGVPVWGSLYLDF